MQLRSFFIVKSPNVVRTVIGFVLIFALGFNSFAQYKGAPVKKDRLIKALRSKQLQSEDIISVINSNGVDFVLTDDVKKILIAAGARPEVITAVGKNLRLSSNKNLLYAKKDSKKSGYDDLLEKAMYSYREQKNPASAIRYLQTAVKINPRDSKAYQMLGFVNLYGLYNLEETRKYMREAIANGGSAVFRVYHDDSGNFTGRCTGSLYISPEKIRFESDDNVHTFETSSVNVEKIQTDTESSKTWKKHPIFKVLLKFGKEKAKFRFAPISGKEEESNMAAMFVKESRTPNYRGVAMTAN